MLLHNEVEGQMESQGAIFSGDGISKGLQIEKIMNRAHEIHRAHGELFGYDLEDWLEAQREVIERNRPHRYPVEEPAHAETLSWDQEGNRQKCFGLHN